ncbi:MAG: VCBS repeat-containing protein, partial [Abditibacteriales bacterium]|nr:VCBS repeat-containing protein [Abditibacteriales bacterium]
MIFSALSVLLGGGCGKSQVRPTAPHANVPTSQRANDVFVDVAKQAGIDFALSHHGKSPLNIMETLGCGCAFLDYDNDGWLDVFLVGQPTSALFRNKGDGTFENVTAQSGITRKLDWMGCAVGDYDNDGYPDLFVTGYGDCALYRNNAGKGATIFTEVTKQAGIINRNWTSSAAFADADHDGLLDLYVTSYVEFNEKSIQFCTYRGVQSSCGPRFYDAQKGIFYRNLGNGRFVDATKQFGFDTAHGKGLGVIFSDYDNDLTHCPYDGVRFIDRYYTAWDAAGNSSTCSHRFTYTEDTQKPQL